MNYFKFLIVLLFVILNLTLAGQSYGATFTVTKTADTNDGVCNSDCSLREAIGAANAAATNDDIAFDAAVFSTSQTILLGGTQLQIFNNGNLVINGTGSSLLTISGNLLSGVFRIEADATAIINGVKIIDGRQSGNGVGGGILNQLGNLTVNNSIITGNQAGSGGEGGGIYNCGGSVSLNNTTITMNQAGSGGGIFSGDNCVSGRPHSLTIHGSVISNNTSASTGGGIDTSSTLIITNTTLSNNSAAFGAGIYLTGASDLTSVTVTNNTATQSSGGIRHGGFGTLRTLTISGSTISGNSAAQTAGGISCGENSRLTITNSNINSNTTLTGGGGLYNFRGIVNITGSTFNGNQVTSATGSGGGIFTESINSVLNLTSSTVSNNAAANGAGIFADGDANLTDSTINGNFATGSGGGIRKLNGTFTITNSTITLNSANNGGGIHVANFNSLSIVHSTIARNMATTDGGGIFHNNTQTVNLRATIIGDNSAANGTAQDLRGTFTSQGYNLIENATGATITGVTTGNIVGQDAQLVPLRNNGGATNTISLLSTSPAVDAADATNSPAADQRGISRPQDGDLNGTFLPDIGAYERQVTTIFTVTKTADTNDGACNSDCSFREAITAANAAVTPDNALTFAPAVFNVPQTITLSGLGLTLIDGNGTLAVIGPGASLLTINGNNQVRVLVNLGNIAITGLKITGSIVFGDGGVFNGGRMSVYNSILTGNTAAGGSGGALKNYGTMTIYNSTLSGNSSTGTSGGHDGGGAIENDNGSLTIINSTISGNTATMKGGGIRTEGGGTVTINNSTISGNSGFSGGGVYNSSGGTNATLNITNSTISGNTARSDGGGGIHSFSLSLVNLSYVTIAGNIALTDSSGTGTGGGVRNEGLTFNSRGSIFADNTDNASAPDIAGTLTSQGYNLIESTTGTTITGTTTGNILGQDPMLGPLANNGGATLTRALLGRSPAVDAGHPTVFPATDQRGSVRPRDGDANGTVRSDIGAYERFAFGSTPFDFDGDGKTDISIFRPPVGEWWYYRSSDGGNAAFQFGAGTDKIVPADFTGDRRTDVAFWRPSTGEWFILRSEDSSYYSFPFGANGDIPAAGDFDGDGKADVAVFRPSDTTWFILRSSGGVTIQQFGANGDVPVVADYDGDGKADIAIFRPSVGEWWIQKSTGGVIAYTFGNSADKPVQGDYTGDGKADVAIFRPVSGEWFILRSEDSSYYSFPFGTNGDIPAPGDFDGDGKFDAAVFRPTEATWYVQRSTAGTLIQGFGQSGDVPVPSAFIP